jgi:antirestriction protein ArdC
LADTDKKTHEQLMQEYADKLEQGIKEIFTSGRYEEYLRTMSRFHRYSMRNTALIFLQKPDATQVAGFNKWRDEFERFPRKGEKAIKIFAPSSFTVKKEMEKIGEDGKPVLDENGQPVTEVVNVKIPSFKVVSVFDAAQTYGKPLPQLSQTLTGEVQHYDLLRQALEETAPYPVVYEQLDSGTDGYFHIENQNIHIREGMSQPQTVLALIHERSHGELHGNIPENETPEQRAARRNREEVEAESISYTVCQYFGIETGANSFGYIATWSADKELSELQASLETIKKTASNMITSIETRFEELKKEHGIEDIVVEAEAVREKPNEQDARAFAADYVNYMTARNIAHELPPFGVNTSDHLIADITREIMDGSGIGDIRSTLEHSFTTYGESWIVNHSETVTAGDLFRRLRGFEQTSTPEQTAEAPAPEKQYELGYGHMGNGLTVWNRLEERDGDYVTVAHIAPDRTVTFYDNDMPEDVRARIEQTAQTSDMNVSATQDAKVFTTPPQAEQQRESERYSELQQRGFEIARRYENLPLQDRLNIIAETFGCKTASITTSPCTGKWRGTSDISIVFDNGASLPVGNYRTPQAKTVRVQNECVNNALASYNPEIVSETKERAIAPLLKQEAADNEVAAQMGLKPYTFLNVELNSGSDEASGGHLGWYFVTLAVDGEIVTHIETGLESDISRGVVGESRSRPNYFAAGALKDTDVDYIFGNVGFSSTRDLYTVPLTDPVRERAEIKLMERQKTIGQAMQGLQQEVTATLQFLIDRDLQDHGAISESTLEAVAVQGYEYRDGKLELTAPEADTPEKLAQDLYDFAERIDFYGYKSILGIGENEQPLQSITQFVENNGMDFVSLLHLLDSFINDYTDEPDMKEEVRNAKKLYARFTAYDDERQKTLTPKEQERPETNTNLPDPHIGLSERDLYGYTYEGMLPLQEARALELYDQNHTVYLLYPDGTEAMAIDRAEIEQFDGIFGIESEEWANIRKFDAAERDTQNTEAAKEKELLNGTGDRYGIYQVTDYQPYRYDSFDKAMAVMRRDHYTLMYTAPLLPDNTPDNLYALHNMDTRPAADKMRSMSPSDVLVMNRGGNVTALYVDNYGFQPIQGFLERDSHIRAVEMSTEQNYNMIDGIRNNAPTMSEIEADVAAGKTVSLMDIVKAQKNGRKTDPPGKKPSLLGQLEQGKKDVAKNRDTAGKDTPIRKPGLEVD